MNAPAATTFSASQAVTGLPEQLKRLQQRGNSFDLYGARMHAPAATTSSAYRLATSPTRTHALADTVPTAEGRPSVNRGVLNLEELRTHTKFV